MPISSALFVKNTHALHRHEQEQFRYLDANGSEELRVTKWKLYHLLDLRQLLTTTSDVVITNFIQSILLFLTSQNDNRKLLYQGQQTSVTHTTRYAKYQHCH